MKKFLVFFFLFLIVFGQTFSGTINDQSLVENRIAFFNQCVPNEHPRLLVLRKELPKFREFILTLQVIK